VTIRVAVLPILDALPMYVALAQGYFAAQNINIEVLSVASAAERGQIMQAGQAGAMDKPFASLDAPTREGLQNLTLELQSEQQLTTVVVTHSIEEAAFLGRKILLFGPTIEVIENLSAGEPDYRLQPAYQAMVTALRLKLAAGVPAGAGAGEA
jgi:ABC-type antimicrobial peptide transport system ATPase subunit